MDFNFCLKVLDAEQIRQADQFTIKNEPIHSIDLMERASEEFARWFTALFDKNMPVVIFCGTGNNGGDGLVICRLLNDAGYTVSLFCVGDPDSGSRDFKINYDIIQNYDIPQTVIDKSNFPTLGKDTVIIDAIFGSGISRPITGLIADLINHLNAEPCEYRVAVDIASGLGCNHRFEGGAIMNASHTVSFQVPKLSLFLPQNENQSGELIIKSIGLVEEYIQSLSSNYYFSTPAFVRSFVKHRSKFSHKGRAGKNLLVAGSHGKLGAAILAGKACLRSGAGLLTIHTPGCGQNVLQNSVPEAMIVVDEHDKLISNMESISAFDVIGIGPGIGTDKLTASAVNQILDQFDKPMVIDADALNILSENNNWVEKIPQGSVLTPHPGEFKRLVGDWSDDYDRLNRQIEFCTKHKVVVLLKGANTSISNPEGIVVFNSTGNPGMATAGSGDVLTGIITALLGQGYSGFEAALLGAHLHGLAGDLFVRKNAEESLIASDLLEYLPRAMRKVVHQHKVIKPEKRRRH
ncbi:NAD(P)H-hydrate epimerase [Reichenbachiella faecimaris]|uniref:Bifunctional NAD(P)H-hydrate repair enzyme n=1 Tax=Reichenbachiella faecimaris TaxID=692418 RepID=A0A1W2GJ86_REIFA|nr:NAD(P)H-hydrate dehydratase [Reichenbachiella faecimaris]SMD36542.1 NAD(P)H-hydrate epimerase [Reichenbachiella faecimaris]